MPQPIDPSEILQVGFGYRASKVLLSAVKLGVFTALAPGPMTGVELQTDLGLHPRATYDFLDALVALGMLQRSGNGPAAKYANTPETDRFLDKAKPTYIGGILEMLNDRLFRFWTRPRRRAADRQAAERGEARGEADVRGALQRPGAPRAVHAGDDGHLADNFAALRREVRLLRLQDAVRRRRRDRSAVARWSRSAPAHAVPSFDLPVVEPIAQKHIEQRGMSDRVDGRRRRLLQGPAAEGGRDHDGDDPARLEPGEENAPDPRGVRCAAGGRRVRRDRDA